MVERGWVWDTHLLPAGAVFCLDCAHQLRVARHPEVRAIMPTHTEIQQKDSANPSEIATAAAAASGLVSMRKPIR